MQFNFDALPMSPEEREMIMKVYELLLKRGPNSPLHRAMLEQLEDLMVQMQVAHQENLSLQETVWEAHRLSLTIQLLQHLRKTPQEFSEEV